MNTKTDLRAKFTGKGAEYEPKICELRSVSLYSTQENMSTLTISSSKSVKLCKKDTQVCKMTNFLIRFTRTKMTIAGKRENPSDNFWISKQMYSPRSAKKKSQNIRGARQEHALLQTLKVKFKNQNLVQVALERVKIKSKISAI